MTFKFWNDPERVQSCEVQVIEEDHGTGLDGEDYSLVRRVLPPRGEEFSVPKSQLVEPRKATAL